MHHFIAKQITQLSIQNANEAFKIQNDFTNAFRREAVPMLEKLFDRLFGEGELVQIERLEIDLGNISAKDLSSGNFVQLLVQKLEEALTVSIHQAEKTPKRLSIPENHFEQWLHFLEYGNFFWNTLQPGRETWLKDVLDTLGIETKAIKQTTKLFNTNPVALERLVLQHDSIFLKTIVELFTGYKQDKLIEFFQEWQQVLKSINKRFFQGRATEIPRQQEQIFWTSILKKAVVQRQKKTWEQFCIEFLLDQIKKTNSLYFLSIIQEKNNRYSIVNRLAKAKQITRYLSENQGDEFVKYTEKEFVEEQGSEIKTEDRLVEGSSVKPTETKDLEERLISKTSEEKPDTPTMSQDKNIQENQQSPEKRKDSPESDEQNSEEVVKEKKDTVSTPQYPNTSTPQHSNTPIPKHINTPTHQHPNTKKQENGSWYIPHAGVVMLHPFLGHLFRKLGWTENGTFKNDAVLQKAILMIHYLATGEISTPEYQLTLPKFLCGVPLNTPLDHYITLEKEEKEEAENLLQAAIEHWGALGKVSNASIREGFLKREGKLEKSSTGWLLQIEKQTIDILLDKLPWNLGIVKLPQMEEVLKVDWR